MYTQSPLQSGSERELKRQLNASLRIRTMNKVVFSLLIYTCLLTLSFQTHALCCLTISFFKHSQRAAILNDLLDHKYLRKRLNCKFILQLVDSSLSELSIKLLEYVSKSLYSPTKEVKNTLKARVGPQGKFNIMKKKTHM